MTITVTSAGAKGKRKKQEADDTIPNIIEDSAILPELRKARALDTKDL